MILSKSGEIRPGLHLVDLKMFGMPRFGTGFVFSRAGTTCIIDVGTSREVFSVLRYCREASIPLTGPVRLIPSHHHFDHAGGMWRLYQRVRKKTADVKIVTTPGTRALLQDFTAPLERARSTFGDLVGKMKPIPEEAFQLVDPDVAVAIPGTDITVTLVGTPGHTPDHVSPTIHAAAGEPIFSFFGEACGTLYNTHAVKTLATSMPPNYDGEAYRQSLAKLRALEVPLMGFCHFGAIKGAAAVAALLDEHAAFMAEFTERVLARYAERPRTRHVVEGLLPWFASRTDYPEDHQLFRNMSFALVYGLMQDLGLR